MILAVFGGRDSVACNAEGLLFLFASRELFAERPGAPAEQAARAESAVRRSDHEPSFILLASRSSRLSLASCPRFDSLDTDRLERFQTGLDVGIAKWIGLVGQRL